ncbi:pirin domain-containing protein [Cantharellus anzutake]|uniref:pirin domain-containing protein n=1 Tax=Cantharellus anzutake TaxID=1750568 RepID=UPI001906DE24|nr:pirin domain-containing protein [Cantharellus anzutake]KAF8326002.1 pirin domain-containing protein [Cantharellus anzutake]
MASAQQISRSVIKKVLAVETPEGVGAMVRRTIGTPALRNLSPVQQGGFPDHPHRGQTTVTYMLEGASLHEDSAGHKGRLGPGDIQWMTAFWIFQQPVVHAEMPVKEPGLPYPQGMQLWIDLPKEHKLVEPSYQELSHRDIPSAYPQGEDGPVIKIISGKSHGVESPVRPLGDVEKEQQSIFQDIPQGWTAFIYTYTGKLLVNSTNKTGESAHDQFHTLVLSSGSDENGVRLTAAEENTRAFLIAGEPLDQPVVQHGPFVMTSQSEIYQAINDYRTGRNGFEKAHSWKSEIGGL